MDYLVKIRSVQTPLNGQFSIGANTAAAYNLPACARDAQLTPSCWHLPSKTELQYLYNQKTVMGGFANSPYWSSTGFIVKYAWTQFSTLVARTSIIRITHC